MVVEEAVVEVDEAAVEVAAEVNLKANHLEAATTAPGLSNPVAPEVPKPITKSTPVKS